MAKPNIFWPSAALSASISGTIPVTGTVVVSNLIGGTVAISTGTLASITNVAAGTIAIQTGTLATITSVSNVAAGTIAISTGTIASITNIAGGTVTAVPTGTQPVSGSVVVSTIIGGTVAISTGTLATITSITNVAAGTIAISTGTIASITNVAGGTVAINPLKSTVGALTAVTGSTGSFQILATNANRRGATIYNNTAINFFVTLGTVSGTGDGAYTVKLTPGSYYEFPGPQVFSGSVTGIASGTGGTVSVSEFT